MRTFFATMALISSCVVGDARAAFTYSVAPVTTSTNFGSGSNLTVTAFNNGATSGVMTGSSGINVGQITQTSTTVAPATDTANIPLAPLIITINNQNGGGSGAFTVNGTFVVTRSDSSGAFSTFTPGSIAPPTLVLGNFSYTLGLPSYSPPTIGAGGNGNGSLGYFITEADVPTVTAVPEPTSLAMAVGPLALLGIAALRRARRHRTIGE
jgi:hypothetical protein